MTSCDESTTVHGKRAAMTNGYARRRTTLRQNTRRNQTAHEVRCRTCNNARSATTHDGVRTRSVFPWASRLGLLDWSTAIGSALPPFLSCLAIEIREWRRRRFCPRVFPSHPIGQRMRRISSNMLYFGPGVPFQIFNFFSVRPLMVAVPPRFFVGSSWHVVVEGDRRWCVCVCVINLFIH